MKRNTVIATLTAATIALAGATAFAADPSVDQVYRAAEAGNLAQAEAMMNQVLRDHPNSGKAHYIDAQVLAKAGRLDMAKAELATAERLEPGLPFAKPAAVQELRDHLAAGNVRPVAPAAVLAAPRPAPGIPWGLLIVGALLLAAVIYFIRSFNRPRIIPAAGGGAAYGPYGGGGIPAQPYGAGPMAGGGMGSGILGGLATGAAMGASVVAGEEVMRHVLGGNSQAGAATAPFAQPVAEPVAANDYDLGGTDFGVGDGSSWDDASGGSWDNGSSGGDDWS